MLLEPLEDGLGALEVARCDQRLDRGGERACRVAGPQADALIGLDQRQQMVDRGVRVSQREPQKPEGELAADETEMESVSPRKTRSALAGSNSSSSFPRCASTSARTRPPGLPLVRSVRPSSLVPARGRVPSASSRPSSTSASHAR